MVSKIFPLFFILVGLAFVNSEDEFFRMPKLQTILYEIFEKMSQYTQASWNLTAPDSQNYCIFPLLMQMRDYIVLIKIFHGNELHGYISQDEYLEQPYALARILDKLQNTSNVEVAFPNAIFYDRSHMISGFVEDLKSHYHTETYEISSDRQDDQSVTKMINNWTSRVTKGHQSERGSYQTTSMAYHASSLTFTACWQSPKTRKITLTTSKRRKRFIQMPATPVFIKTLEPMKDGIELEAFRGRDTIGYYNDVEKQFEAIRIPFKNEDFAMVVMLPYYNQSLDIFSQFTGADYRQVLERVDEYYEIVDYTIPVINSSAILINRNGASINGGNLCGDTEVPEDRNATNFHHRPFIVDRPFGIIIYHEPTSFVFMYSLVKNPSPDFKPASKYEYRVDKYVNFHNIW